MPDRLTDAERAAIHAFKGRVTRLADHAPAPGRKPSVSTLERRRRVAEMFPAKSAKQIAVEMGLTAATVYADLRAQGLSPGRKRGSGDVLSQKKADRAEKGADRVFDRRRFKVQPVPFGSPAVLAPADAAGTIFPARVFTPDGEELVLKDGCNNAKIGGDVLVGWLKGAYIATLTLEERATCPRSCLMWRGCYGNTMHHSRRWAAGPELEEQIRREVAIACEKNERVLIRLHVLGDFYSTAYLQMWADLLDAHDGLHIFGFTAHADDSEIGRGIAWLRDQVPQRFAVRTSGRSGRWGSFTIPFPTDAKRIGDAIVCPEQLDAMAGSKRGRHCGSCGVCWSTDAPVAFVEH